jgi:hypothetical protein
LPAIIGANRVNPNGGSVALGHLFGATGARILSLAVKELAATPSGTRVIVSICADGGQGSVALLENRQGRTQAQRRHEAPWNSICHSKRASLSRAISALGRIRVQRQRLNTLRSV